MFLTWLKLLLILKVLYKGIKHTNCEYFKFHMSVLIGIFTLIIQNYSSFLKIKPNFANRITKKKKKKRCIKLYTYDVVK